jgi:peptidoglycan/xylan/chitin deacetylase (PgdA/CDA1 family)
LKVTRIIDLKALVAVGLLLALSGLTFGKSRNRDLADDGLFNPENALFKRGAPADRAVALTFDDGPHPASANRILDILKQNKIHATFFVVGEKVVLNPAIVRRMVADNNEVGNHTMTHPRLDELTAEGVRKELLGCDAAVRNATGREMSLMRPPGMRFNPMVLRVAKSLGYDTIGWNVGAKDFTPAKTDPRLPESVLAQLDAAPAEVADRVVEHVKNGSIILLHDSPGTAAALPEIIRDLRKAGYKFETVSQMMRDLPEPVAVVANPLVRKSP